MVTDKDLTTVLRASRPSFRNPADKTAFAVHASFLASGYFLTAVGPPAFADAALCSSSSSTEEVGIDGWNEVEGEYAFVYAKNIEGSGGSGTKKVLVKCLVLSDKLLVDALSDAAASQPVHLEINIMDYNGEENNRTNYAVQFKNLDKLAKALNDEILSKLEFPPTGYSSGKCSSSRTGEELREDPYQPDPQRGGPYMDPSGIIHPPIPMGGNSDLFPGPGAGMYPTRGDFGGGSMMIGPNDPRWFGDRGGQPGFNRLPHGVPPGARFDPYGPPGIGGFEHPRRNPGAGRGTRIHPDLEQPGAGLFHPDWEHSDYI